MKIHADYEIIMTLFIVGTESMGMNKSRTSPAKQDLLLALGINAVLLGIFLCFLTPYYETNDDIFLSHFVDGSMAVRQSRMVYINAAVGALLKGLYTLLPSAPWYALLQYAMIFAGFTAMMWVMIERWERIPAIMLSVAVISFFGLDAYIRLQYTKTAAVATVFGLMLMVHALSEAKGTKTRGLCMTLGTVLALLGGLYRDKQFLACGVVACWMLLDNLIAALKNSADAKVRLYAFFETVRPFILLLLLFGIFKAADRLVYSDGWKEYLDYNDARTQLTDFGGADYETHREAYDELGISKTLSELINDWNFYDPDKLDTDTFLKLAALSKSNGDKAFSIKDFASGLLPRLVRYWCFAGLALVVLVWLLAGKHCKSAWEAVLLSVFSCAALLLVTYTMGRAGMYRVDYGLILAFAAVLLLFIPGRKISARRMAFCTVVTLISAAVLFFAYMRYWGPSFAKETDTDHTPELQALTALRDDGHLIFADISAVSMYSSESPLGEPVYGMSDKLIPLGGWMAEYPPITQLMLEYGVTNPYKDCVGNDGVYVLFYDIELFMRYVNETYAPDARAVQVEPLSSQTGLPVYRITTG